jgi:hypothetical protein
MTLSFSPRSKLLAPALSSLLLLTLTACQESQQLGDDGGPDGDTDCASACQSKATSCGEPASDAVGSCAMVCGGSPTDSQLSCIQSMSCDSLILAFEQQEQVCGIVLPKPDGNSSLNCMTACMDKAVTCGEQEDGNAAAPDSGAAADCAGICARSPTNTQIECIESSSCSALSAAFAAKGTVCGIGGDGG